MLIPQTRQTMFRFPSTRPGRQIKPFAAGTPLIFPTGDQFSHNNFASLSYKPPTNSPIVTPVTLGAEFDPNSSGVTQSWNFSIEQQITSNMAIHVAYVGSESYHQSVYIDANAARLVLAPPILQLQQHRC